MARRAPPARIQCASATVSGTDASASAEFTLSKNVWAATPIGSIADVHDPTHPRYLLSRCAHILSIQPQFCWAPSTRSGWITDWTNFHNDNPLCHVLLHSFPLHNIPGFRTLDRDKYHAVTSWAQSTANIDRTEVILGVNSTDADEIRANRQTSTTNPNKQAGWHLRVYSSAAAEFLSDMTCDVLCGTNLTGEGMGGGDVSSFMSNHHDGSTTINPKPGSSLRKVKSAGTVVSIISTGGSPPQPIEVRLPGSISFDTSGTLPEDSSYAATVQNHPLWFIPPGDKGFIGFHVKGIKTAGANTDVYLKELSSLADSTQFHTPAAGWRYCLNDNSSGSNNVDWDGDGAAEDRYTVGQFNWATGFNLYWDKLSEKAQAAVGHGMGRGCNTVSDSHVIKRSEGLPHPHGQYQMFDWVEGESMGGHGQFAPAAGAHGYDCSNTNMDRMMRALSFGNSFLAPAVTSPHVGNKARGAFLEAELWGSDYSDINDLDASYLRFQHAIRLLFDDLGIFSAPEDSANFMVAAEEWWIDMNTNYTSQNPIGTYDPSGGPTGSAGHPVGAWTWNTADAGERIYIRRRGDWLIAVNLADAPAGYDSYAPTHLAGGFTARDPEDVITQADIDATGLLSGGETLSHFNPATYVNTRATNRLIELSPSIWTGFSYGPRQAHPADSANRAGSSYTLSNLPNIARDNTKNDGSAVSFPYNLGPLEAVFWEIS